MFKSIGRVVDLSTASLAGPSLNNKNRLIQAREITTGDDAGKVLVIVIQRGPSGTSLRAYWAIYDLDLEEFRGASATGFQLLSGGPSGLQAVNTNGIDSCIGNDGVIRIAFLDNLAGVGGVKYASLTTTAAGVATWVAGTETISGTVPEAGDTVATGRISITVDGDNVPHVAWVGLAGDLGDEGVRYKNRIGGVWSTEESPATGTATRQIALRYAGNILGLFYQATVTEELSLLTRGVGASDIWGTALDITSATSTDEGTGQDSTLTAGINGDGLYWNVVESADAWHVSGTDFSALNHRYMYTRIAATTTPAAEFTERAIATADMWTRFDEGWLSDSSIFVPTLVCTENGDVVSHIVAIGSHNVSNRETLMQISSFASAEGFEPGLPHQIFVSGGGALAHYGAASRIILNRAFVLINVGGVDLLCMAVSPERPDTAGLTHDITINDVGYMLAGPMNKVDITSSIPRISIAAEQKRYFDFSELDTFGQNTFHQGRGEKYLQNPEAFQDSENVLTHIPNQITLALKDNLTYRTGGTDPDFLGTVVKFIVYNSNFHALIEGTAVAANKLFTWDNTNTEWDVVVMDAAADTIMSTAGAQPRDMAVYGGDLWIALGEAVNMVFFDLSASLWKDGQQPARAITLWDGKLWRADNLNEVYWSTNPDAGSPTWTLGGTAGDTDSFINSLLVYQDALFVFKEDSVWAVERSGASNTYTVRLISDENAFRDVDAAGSRNGVAAFTDRGLLYWNRREQVVRFDGTTTTLMGPERGADTLGGNFFGLPADEQGEFTAFATDGQFLYGAMEPRHTSTIVYPQVMVYNGVGWHSFWKGATVDKHCHTTFFLPIRTATGVLAYPTLWIGDGANIRYIKLPRMSYNPVDDATLTYVASGWLKTAHFDAALPDVKKVFAELILNHDAGRSNCTIQPLIQRDERTAGTLTNHDTPSQGYWPIAAATNPLAKVTRYVLGEATDADTHDAFGGISGGNCIAKALGVMVALAGTGAANATPVLRGYALRFVTKPQERFGWTVPVKIYSDIVRLDGLKETRSIEELRKHLYDARASSAPVVLVEDGPFATSRVNMCLDPTFLGTGLATVGTLSESLLCTLHTLKGERSQWLYTTNTGDAGARYNLGTLESAVSVVATVWILNWGPRPVTVQLTEDTTVLAEKMILTSPEWQEVTISLTGPQVAAGTKFSNFSLRIMGKASPYNLNCHVGGLQLIFGTTESVSYIDGDQPGCYWTGLPGSNRSVRRAGHRVYVTGINEVYRFRKTEENEPRFESEITLQLREVL